MDMKVNKACILKLKDHPSALWLCRNKHGQAAHETSYCRPAFSNIFVHALHIAVNFKVSIFVLAQANFITYKVNVSLFREQNYNIFDNCPDTNVFDNCPTPAIL